MKQLLILFSIVILFQHSYAAFPVCSNLKFQSERKEVKRINIFIRQIIGPHTKRFHVHAGKIRGRDKWHADCTGAGIASLGELALGILLLSTNSLPGYLLGIFLLIGSFLSSIISICTFDRFKWFAYAALAGLAIYLAMFGNIVFG